MLWYIVVAFGFFWFGYFVACLMHISAESETDKQIKPISSGRCLCGYYQPAEDHTCQRCGSHNPATPRERSQHELAMLERDTRALVIHTADTQLELRQHVGTKKSGELLNAERRGLLVGSGDKYLEIQRS